MATPTDGTVPLTGTNPFIDGLTWGASWVFPGPAHVITYSFSQWPSPYTGGSWTPAWKSAAAQAFQTWANVADLRFVEVGSGSQLTQSPADMALALTWELGVYLNAASLGFPPSPSFADQVLQELGLNRSMYPRPEGDLWFDHTWPPFASFQPGKMGFEIVIHEIGHALGLKHPFDEDGGSRPTFTELGISQYENQDWTVMSYTHGTSYDDGLSHVITPMVLDILAIQHIYGANMSYRTGNDRYVLTDRGVKEAIWDAGGIDTIDASRVPSGIELDLHAGSVNHYGFHAGHVGIAFNVTIENGIGTPYHDHLIGNDADNVLQGNAGDDYLAGGLGNDTYVTDGLDDVVEQPGEGADTLQGAVTLHLGPNIENAVLTGAAALSAYGNELDNQLTGNAGNNLLDGGAGADVTSGAAGNDRYFIDNMADVVIELAGQGDDSVESYVSFVLGPNVERLKLLGADNIDGQGNDLDNWIVGNAGMNLLAGGPGNDIYEADSQDSVFEALAGGIDTVRSYADCALGDNLENLILLGGARYGTGNALANVLTAIEGGAHVLDGGRGADQMIGSAGNDRYLVDFSLDQVTEGAAQGQDTLVTAVPFAAPANVEYVDLQNGAGNISSTGNGLDNVLTGNDCANLLEGGAGKDQLYGGDGEDTLLGGADADRLDGGLGRDTLVGGAGSDRFVFDTAIDSGTNVDQIVDFVHGQDGIDLAATIFTALEALGPGAALSGASPIGNFLPGAGGLELLARAATPGVGAIAAGLGDSEFVSGPGAVAREADDHVIHDTSTGMLYYDADGGGAQQMLPFAQVLPGQSLDHQDFNVIA